ncbi:hypothetical protein ABZZ17_11015 [Streptomyces sp. NPDC006512]|uniref:DUF11 domain-containing protein n=1 Tax=Streptomyces sp. NPDC006512 TaxID=3154307 RepID=UPI0033AE95BF
MPRAVKHPGRHGRRTLGAVGALAACWLLPLAPAAAWAGPDAEPGTPEAPASVSPEPPARPAAAAAPSPVAAPSGAATPGEGPADAPGAVPGTAREGAVEPVVPSGSAAASPARDHGSANLAVSAALLPAAPAAPERREHREDGGRVARETFDYLVTVTNHGPSTARQVRVTDRLPASLEFVASRDGCTASGRTVTCGPLPALAVGASHSWVITVRLSAGYAGDGTDIVNEAAVGADTPDPETGNNTATLTGLEIPPSARDADLSLRKTALLAPGRKDVRPGEKFTYLITVRNQGPATARQLRVTDRLPASLTLVSSPDDCAVPKGEDRLVVCPPTERLAAGETAEYRITVRAVTGDRAARPPGGTCAPIDNVARVTSASLDPDLSDNANRRGTTGPGGGRLCLVTGRGEEHHGHQDHHGRDDGHDGSDHHGPDHDGRGDQGHPDHGRDDQHGRPDPHAGRGDLADSGAGVPGPLLWVSAGLVLVGAALRRAFRARA